MPWQSYRFPTPEAATAEWLAEVLRSGGVLTDGQVPAVTREPAGEGH